MESRGSAARSRGAGGASAVLAGFALLASCGTAQAGSAAPATVGATATATPTTTPTAAAAPTTAASPTTAPVRVPLVLPSAGRIGGAMTGSVSGLVTLGLNRCLFLRTDAGQRFGLEGPLAEQVRTLIIGRGVPVPQGHSATQGNSATQGHSTPADLPGTAEVRITARGTVTTGASVCSAGYQFIAASGDVVSTVSTTAP